MAPRSLKAPIGCCCSAFRRTGRPATFVRKGASINGVRTAIRAADWFGRFRIEQAATGDGITVIDRDGTLHTGAAAASLVGSRLPLTFVLAAPLVPLTRRRRRRAPARPVALGEVVT